METTPPRRPRIKDIAASVGVSTMLVSIALRGMPGVSEQTRKKIQACAKRLGYRPDPALSALADYRRRSRPATAYTQIAYVTTYTPKDDPVWDYTKWFLEGAKKRGLEFGYDVIPYWLPEGGCTPRQASSILFNRGIKGLLIAPLPHGVHELDLTWKYFSPVAIGPSLSTPRIDYAAFDHHDAMQIVLAQLRARDYRRIGLFLMYNDSARLHYTPLDAFMGDQSRQPEEARVPPFIPETFSTQAFWRWFDRHRPDAIVTDANFYIIDILKERGLRAPRDVGVACFSRFTDMNPTISAVTQDLRAIGSAAVDRLHTNLLRSAYGVPEHSHGTLLHGHWEEGTTLRKRR